MIKPISIFIIYKNLLKSFTKIVCILFFFFLFSRTDGQFMIGSVAADTNSVITGLDTPWEILWGPDNFIWFTERPGKVSRLNPVTRERHLLLTIPEIREDGESGLLGMVLHPNFNTEPYVYLVYNYSDNGIKERLVRYTYNNGQLISPQILLEELRGSATHNGSRLLIGSDNKLYMTTGDAQDRSTPQNTNSLSGKILRLNLDGTVPEDNPISGNYLWSLGHRNPQGMEFIPDGKLFISEHGPANDDEINIITKGGNYGWPEVEGYCNLPSEISRCSEWNVIEPVQTWTPTIAPAGISYYNFDVFPEWKNTILLTTLAGRRLVSLKLNENNTGISESKTWFENRFGRLRDICISPTGIVYISTSNNDGRGNPVPGDDRIIMIYPRYPVQLSNPQSMGIKPKIFYSNSNLHIEPGIDSGDFVLLNILGKVLSSGHFNSNSFNLNLKLNRGIYFIKIQNSNSSATSKFSIN